MIAALQAIILGIVEGITEFLPISSTGHLIVAEHALGFKDVKDLFTVVIQVGAIFAVLWYFRLDLWERLTGLFRREAEAIRFWKLLIIGTVPAGLLGLALDKSMEKITTPTVVACALIIGGIVLWLVENKPQQPKRRSQQENIDFRQLSLKRALFIGLGQCVAIIPGVSRSGATIVSGLMTGLNRPTATAFSFYLSIPVLVLASGYKIAKYHSTITTLPGGVSALLIGVAVSFITALLAISWLLKYISHHGFKSFAYYRIAAGVLILALVAFHWL